MSPNLPPFPAPTGFFGKCKIFHKKIQQNKRKTFQSPICVIALFAFHFSAGPTFVIPIGGSVSLLQTTSLHQPLSDDRATVRQALMSHKPRPIGWVGVSAKPHTRCHLLSRWCSGNPKLVCPASGMPNCTESQILVASHLPATIMSSQLCCRC